MKGGARYGKSTRCTQRRQKEAAEDDERKKTCETRKEKIKRWLSSPSNHRGLNNLCDYIFRNRKIVSISWHVSPPWAP